MKILNSQQTQLVDKYTIENQPIKSINLMEKAANKCYNWIQKNIEATSFKVFVGPGNNGGDGLAIARMLYNSKYRVEVYILNITKKYSEDFDENLKRLIEIPDFLIFKLKNITDFPTIFEDDVIIDAIFGSGLNKPVSGLVADVINLLNEKSKTIIAISTPSGLFTEQNHVEPQTIIKANYTLTFQSPFLSFFFGENYDYVGEFIVLPIGLDEKFIETLECNYLTIEQDFIKKILKPRKKFSHKGNYGHGLLIAGSLGKMGAAVMAAKACHRTGIGLLTVHTPKCGCEILQTTSHETMLSVDQQEEHSSDFYDLTPYKTIAIGPGIGLKRPTRLMLKVLIETYKCPTIFDADAITIIADNKDWLNKITKNSIFTPHPREFERLIGTSQNNFERSQKASDFSRKFSVYVVLKGAHTEIYCPDGICYINTTGNPGMAKGGSGDVLTGMILSFLTQGYTEKEACLLGVYVHGLSGDLAASKYGVISMQPTDLIKSIYKSFEMLSN